MEVLKNKAKNGVFLKPELVQIISNEKFLSNVAMSIFLFGIRNDVKFFGIEVMESSDEFFKARVFFPELLNGHIMIISALNEINFKSILDFFLNNFRTVYTEEEEEGKESKEFVYQVESTNYTDTVVLHCPDAPPAELLNDNFLPGEIFSGNEEVITGKVISNIMAVGADCKIICVPPNFHEN